MYFYLKFNPLSSNRQLLSAQYWNYPQYTYNKPPIFSSRLYPLSLFVREKGVGLRVGVAAFGDESGISCGPVRSWWRGLII